MSVRKRTFERFIHALTSWLQFSPLPATNLTELNQHLAAELDDDAFTLYFLETDPLPDHFRPRLSLNDWPCSCGISDPKPRWCPDTMTTPFASGPHFLCPLSVADRSTILVMQGPNLKATFRPFALLLMAILQRPFTHPHDSQQDYRRLFERLPVGIYRTTPDGRIVDINPAFLQMLGYTSPDEVLNKNVLEFYGDPGRRKKWQAAFAKRDAVINYELTLKRANGEIIWVNDSARRIRLPDGSVIYEGVLQNITDRKILETEWVRHIQRLEQHRDLMGRLFTDTHVIERDLHESIPYITEQVAPLVDFERIAVWVITPDERQWNLVDALDISSRHHTRGLRFPRRDDFIEWLKQRRFIEVRNPESVTYLPDHLLRDMQRRGIHQLLMAPAQIGGRILGMIVFECTSPKQKWHPYELILAGDLADLLGQLILSHRVREQARMLQAMNRVITRAQFLTDVDELLDLYINELRTLADVPIAYIRVLDFEHAVGRDPETMAQLLFILTELEPTPDRPTVFTREQLRELLHDTEFDFKSLALIPLKANHHIEAFALLTDTREKTWSEELLQAATNLAHQLILLINRIIHDDQERRRSELMLQLQHISTGLNAPRSVDDTIAFIGRSTHKLLQADRVIVLRRDADLRTRIQWPPDLELELRRELTSCAEELPGISYLTGDEPVFIPDLARLPDARPLRRLTNLNYRSLAAWSIPFGDNHRATLVALFRRPRTLDIVELEAMDAFTRQASAALTNARLLEHIQHLGQRDPLTKLYNRSYFEEALNHAVATARLQNITHALLILDLDHFATINDSLGHTIADKILREVGEVLAKTARPGEIVARLIGDSFAVLAHGLSSIHAMERARMIKQALARHRYSVDLQPYRITCTIGIAMIDLTTPSATDALAQADAACATAKNLGRNRIRLFQPEDIHRTRMVAEDLRLSETLRKALQNQQLHLYYQPIFNLIEEKIHAYEALLRLRDGDHILNAYDFIPVAERFALLPDLDLWVVETTLKTLQHHAELGHPIRLSVNLSGPTLEQSETLRDIEHLIARFLPPGGHFIFEITENTALTQLVNAADWIQHINARFGIPFALDDFGIGFSSFGHLKHLPIHYLKIDMNFIQSIFKSEIDKVLVQSMLHICHSLKFKAIAEGVENARIYQALRELKIPYGQGFYLGPPAPSPMATENLEP